MDANKRLGDFFADVFERIEKEVLNDIVRGSVSEENTITGRLLSAAQSHINNFASNQPKTESGLNIQANHFSSSGRGSQETLTGADGAIFLDISIGTTLVQKFYLFQAKRTLKSNRIDDHARKQRDKMLKRTSDSFFLFYSRNSFDFVSAFMVNVGDKPANLPSKTYTEFHQDFFNCFIGDQTSKFPFPISNIWMIHTLKLDKPWVNHFLKIEITD
ncbi:MAG: hypothetical protein Q8K48_06070 [Candidatus Planktophila sp.]|nr:hypothetical protein [Candidatus Planktophila sp.]